MNVAGSGSDPRGGIRHRNLDRRTTRWVLPAIARQIERRLVPVESTGPAGSPAPGPTSASSLDPAGSAAPATSHGPTANRQAWVDRLRITVITAVIVMHASTTYVVEVGASYVERTTNPVTTSLVTGPMVAGLLFGLGPLFLLAGWLSARSVRKHGAGHYLRGRAVRLGVPMLIYLLIVGPAADSVGAAAMEPAEAWTQFFFAPLLARDLGPAWFLATLLIFCLGYGAIRLARPARHSTAGSVNLSVLAGWMLAIAAANFVVWLYWGYDRTSPMNANWAHWPQAAGLFLLGTAGGERGWFDEIPAALSRRCFRLMGTGLLALAAVAAVAVAGDGNYRSLTGGWHWQAAAFAVLDGLISVSVAVWAIGAYQRRWNAPPGRLGRGLTRWSYAAYLLHPLLLTVLAVSARSLPWPPEIKFVVLVIVGVPLSFLAARLLTRVPYLDRIV